MNTLVTICELLGGIGITTGAISYFLDEKSKKSIRERTTAVWMKFEESDSLIVVKAPLTFLAALLDSLYGERAFSWKGFWRCCFVSTTLALTALLLTGAFMHKPFGMNMPPWKAFDETLTAVRLVSENPKSFETATPEQQEVFRRLCSTVLSYHTPGYKWLYVTLFVVLVSVLNWFMDFACLVISRRLLRDMIEATSFVTLFALHTVNFIFVAIAGTICLSSVVIAATPFTWAILGFLGLLVATSKFFAGCLVVPAIWCAIWFSPIWVRVFAVVAALPSVLLLLVTLVAFVLSPWRNALHRRISRLLDKIALREKAVVAIGVVIVVGIVVLLSYTPTFFG